MKVCYTSEGMQADVGPREIVLFCNVLNEVCNGFAVRSFETTIGPRSQVLTLFDRLRGLSTERSARIPIAEADFTILQNALRESLLELGTEEFYTRTGLDFGFGKDLLRELEERGLCG